MRFIFMYGIMKPVKKVEVMLEGGSIMNLFDKFNISRILENLAIVQNSTTVIVIQTIIYALIIIILILIIVLMMLDRK